jgi:hypothetical protein
MILAYTKGPCRSSSSQSLASHCGGPGLHPGSMWDLWWTKRHGDRFSPSTSVSPANHYTNFSIIIITGGWHNRPNSRRSDERSELDSTHPYQFKKVYKKGTVEIDSYVLNIATLERVCRYQEIYMWKPSNRTQNFIHYCHPFFFLVRLLALRPLLAYCASLGW